MAGHAGEVGDVGHGQAGVGDGRGRAAARHAARQPSSCSAGGQLDHAGLVVDRQQARLAQSRRSSSSTTRRVEPALDGLDALVQRRLGVVGQHGTASWARIGPWSTCSVARCTVQPVTFTPKAARRARRGRPGTAGSSDGWVFRTAAGVGARTSAPAQHGHEAGHRHDVRRPVGPARPTHSLGVGDAVEARSRTTSRSTSASARRGAAAIVDGAGTAGRRGRPRRARPAATASSSRIVPLPDARTASSGRRSPGSERRRLISLQCHERDVRRASRA